MSRLIQRNLNFDNYNNYNNDLWCVYFIAMKLLCWYLSNVNENVNAKSADNARFMNTKGDDSVTKVPLPMVLREKPRTRKHTKFADHGLRNERGIDQESFITRLSTVSEAHIKTALARKNGVGASARNSRITEMHAACKTMQISFSSAVLYTGFTLSSRPWLISWHLNVSLHTKTTKTQFDGTAMEYKFFSS